MPQVRLQVEFEDVAGDSAEFQTVLYNKTALKDMDPQKVMAELAALLRSRLGLEDDATRLEKAGWTSCVWAGQKLWKHSAFTAGWFTMPDALVMEAHRAAQTKG